MTSKINKNVANTFVSQRKCILTASKNIFDPQEAKINSDISIIEILRCSKKDSNVFQSLVALCPYKFRLIKTNKNFEVERVYNKKDILTACELYQKNDCSPAFLESIALEHRTKALIVVADSIIKAEENVTLLTNTLTELGRKSNLYDSYLEKLELAKSSLANKVTLLQLAKNI